MITNVINVPANLVYLGTFTIGPVVDRLTIRAHPLSLFREGQQNKSVEIFVGTVAGEGLPFVPLKTAPYLVDWKDQKLEDYVADALPLLNDTTIDAILALYNRNNAKYLSYLFAYLRSHSA
jgi:carboxylesterase type B